MKKKQKLTELPRFITINLEEKAKRVLTRDYVRAKTKDLRQFGYESLKESEVEEQLLRLLNGKNWSNVIGGFIERDKPQTVE